MREWLTGQRSRTLFYNVNPGDGQRPRNRNRIHRPRMECSPGALSHKKPVIDGWQARVINADNASQYFNGQAQNIGVALGATSRGLTDIDLDCHEAIAIAPYLLPPTRAIFGRASKRASHWLY